MILLFITNYNPQMLITWDLLYFKLRLFGPVWVEFKFVCSFVIFLNSGNLWRLIRSFVFLVPAHNLNHYSHTPLHNLKYSITPYTKQSIPTPLSKPKYFITPKQKMYTPSKTKVFHNPKTKMDTPSKTKVFHNPKTKNGYPFQNQSISSPLPNQTDTSDTSCRVLFTHWKVIIIILLFFEGYEKILLNPLSRLITLN